MSKKKKELILTYQENKYGDYSDEEGTRSTETVEWYPLGVYVDEQSKKAREKTKEWQIERLDLDGIINPGDMIWIVVVRYTTGGTFCNTSGAWCLEAVFREESEAKNVASLIEEDEKAMNAWCLLNPNFKRKLTDKPPKDKYKPEEWKPWRGHFEELEFVEVHNFKVQ